MMRFFLSACLCAGCLFCSLPSRAGVNGPHARLVAIWAYGDVVTDSIELSTEQNNLRFYCSTEEELPADSVAWEFFLEGHDKSWFNPFPEGWYFYTDLPPGNYVFRARCRYGEGPWGPALAHAFSIACPWWRTWWAYTLYAVAGVAVVLILLLQLRARIRLHNQLRIEQETNRFRTDFVIRASRQFHTPITVIRSTIEKLTGGQHDRLTRTDLQHLRNSSRQLTHMLEELVEFNPDDEQQPYGDADDVMEMTDVPINDMVVLVVEPSQQLADIIRRELLKYVKVTLHDGGDGYLQALQATAPAAVVLDMQLCEGASPYTLIQQTRAHSHAPIILISDFENKRDILRALRSDADDYLRKPFNSEILATIVLKRIRAVRADSNAPTAEAPADGEKKTDVVLEKRTDKLFLLQIDAIVADHLAEEDFDVNRLAAALKCSRGQLYRKVRMLRGVTPVECIRAKRLEQAAALLRTTQLSVQEVMLRVGMADATNFYRRFKEKYGTSPNGYRNA